MTESTSMHCLVLAQSKHQYPSCSGDVRRTQLRNHPPPGSGLHFCSMISKNSLKSGFSSIFPKVILPPNGLDRFQSFLRSARLPVGKIAALFGRFHLPNPRLVHSIHREPRSPLGKLSHGGCTKNDYTYCRQKWILALARHDRSWRRRSLAAVNRGRPIDCFKLARPRWD